MIRAGGFRRRMRYGIPPLGDRDPRPRRDPPLLHGSHGVPAREGQRRPDARGRRLGPPPLLRRRRRRDDRDLGPARRRAHPATTSHPRSRPGSACRRGSTTSRSTRPTSTTSSTIAIAGSTSETTWSRSTTVGAPRSTPTTRTASRSSSARRPPRSPTHDHNEAMAILTASEAAARDATRRRGSSSRRSTGRTKTRS